MREDTRVLVIVRCDCDHIACRLEEGMSRLSAQREAPNVSGRGVKSCGPENNNFTEMCCGTEAGSYLRRIDSCITQLKAQGPSRTCNESKEEDRRRRLQRSLQK